MVTNFKSIMFKPIIWTSIWCTFCEIACRWMPTTLINEKLICLQAMDWCLRAKSRYMNLREPIPMSQYVVTGPPSIKIKNCSVYMEFGKSRLRVLYWRMHKPRKRNREICNNWHLFQLPVTGYEQWLHFGTMVWMADVARIQSICRHKSCSR